MRQCALLALLISSFVGTVVNAQDGSAASRLISEKDLDAIEGETPAYTTVGADKLDPSQLEALARVFDIRPEEIAKFRWSPSMAPSGHQDAGTTRLAVWRPEGQGLVRTSIKVSRGGQVSPEPALQPPPRVEPPRVSLPQPGPVDEDPFEDLDLYRKRRHRGESRFTIGFAPLLSFPMREFGDKDKGLAEGGGRRGVGVRSRSRRNLLNEPPLRPDSVHGLSALGRGRG